MEHTNRRQSIEDVLTQYCTFLERLHRTVEAKGEALVLQRLIEQPRLIRIMQDAYLLLFLETRDFSKLSPELLVGFESWGLEISALIKLNLPPAQRHGLWHDLGENVPSAYINRLLQKPHPFYIFETYLMDIELSKLCSREIVRRSIKHSEIEWMLKYKANTPKREALEYLWGKNLYERAQLADKYGLKGLAQYERTIGRSLADVEAFQKKRGLSAWIARAPEFNKRRFNIISNFPEYEKKLALSLDKAGLVAGASIVDWIDVQTTSLIIYVAVEKYGLLPIKESHPQKHETDRALSNIYKELKIREKATGYKKRLDRGLPYVGRFPVSEEETVLAYSNAEMEAMEGLWEGADHWAGKDVDDIIVAGLTGHLIGSLKKAVKYNLLGAVRKEDPQFAKLWQKARVMYKPETPEERRKLLGKVKNLRDKLQWKEPLNPEDEKLFDSLEEDFRNAVTPLSLDGEIKDEGGDSYCLGDTIEDKQAQGFLGTIEEPIDLKDLGLNIDELTPKQIQVLREIADATIKDIPLTKYWGRDYARKKKMHERMIKTKLKKL